MTKHVQILVEKPASEATHEAGADDLVFLKKQKERQIRMQLDKFAKELSQVEKKRNEH